MRLDTWIIEVYPCVLMIIGLTYIVLILCLLSSQDDEPDPSYHLCVSVVEQLKWVWNSTTDPRAKVIRSCHKPLGPLRPM